MASNLLSLAGWYVLPNLVSGYVQSFLYSVLIRAGDPKPAPGSRRWVRDRRNVQIFVILAYLMYTIYDADHQLQRAGDFYQLLGLSYKAEEKTILSKFRRLTVQYHPDKVTGPDRSAVEAIYVKLQIARDTLVDPAKRFAYDRFGPEMLLWQSCKTVRDYVIRGLQITTGYYVATGGAMMLLSTLGYIQSGKFWRYLTMVSLFMVEVHLATRPTYPAVLTRVINPILITTGLRTPYLPFQLVSLLRKLSITFFIALVQLGPLIRGSQRSSNDDKVSSEQLDRLEGLAKAAELETTRLTGLELTPFATQQPSMKDLRTSLKEWLIHNTVRNDDDVKKAMNVVLERRRAQGDHRVQGPDFER